MSTFVRISLCITENAMPINIGNVLIFSKKKEMQIVECVKKSIQFLIKLRRMPNLKIKGIVLIVSDE